jgi:hypothetical protein
MVMMVATHCMRRRHRLRASKKIAIYSRWTTCYGNVLEWNTRLNQWALPSLLFSDTLVLSEKWKCKLSASKWIAKP